MRILVTGGAGFIGSHIVDAYLRLGHTVSIIDNLSSGREKFINPAAHFYKADISDPAAVADIFKREQPEALNHHAAQMEVRRSVSDPKFDAQVNILGLLNLMETGKNYGLKKIIFASSGGAIYGDADILPTPENYPVRPASPYGISKFTCELYLDFYAQTYKLPFVALRYGNVYGPRQNPHGEAGVVAIFTRKLLAGETPVINGDGEQARDFVFVTDVVNANVRALERTAKLQVNIGTSQKTTVNTIFHELVKLTGSMVGETHGPVKPGEQRVSVLKTELAKLKLNWTPQVTLTEGLARTVEYFKNEN